MIVGECLRKCRGQKRSISNAWDYCNKGKVWFRTFLEDGKHNVKYSIVVWSVILYLPA